MKRTLLTVGLVGLIAVGGLAGCSKSSDNGGGTTTTTKVEPTTTTNSYPINVIIYDTEIQRELQQVGCYSGNLDGIVGPATDVAILAFQRAKGLGVTGVVDKQTRDALSAAADAGQKVCAPSPTTTTGGSTTTSTTKPAGAVCTGTAIVAALAPGAQVQSFVCSGTQWAAGSLTNGQKFILNGTSGSWKIPSTDVCSGGAADLPDFIKTAGCP